MLKKYLTSGFLGLALSCSSAVSAALINLNYTNLSVTGGNAYSSVEMLADGIGVSISAFTIENNGTGEISELFPLLDGGNGVYVSGSSSGNLGVVSGASDGSLLDGGSVADDLDEGLLFAFDRVVNLNYINFDYFTDKGGDDFNLTVDGDTILWDVNANNSADFSPFVGNVAGQFDEYNFYGISGQNFLIWADGNSDSFRIDKIQVSAVAEPQSLFLLMLGLLGVCWGKLRLRRL